MTTLHHSNQRSDSTAAADHAKPNRLPWRWIIGIAIPAGLILAFAIFQPILVLPRMGLGPGFGLFDINGERVTNEDLRGKIVLYNVTYTNCIAPCAQTTAVMAELHDLAATMNLRGIPFAMVTVSIDPTRDTPEQLQQFAQQFTTETTGNRGLVPWYFVTGEALPLKYVVGGGFGIYYKENEADGSITLDPAFVLIDGAGIMRAKYRTATPELKTLQRDIELVAKEAAESTGATRLAYEAAHLFLCYPK